MMNLHVIMVLKVTVHILQTLIQIVMEHVVDWMVVKVIVRERRRVTGLGVAVALVLMVGQWLLSALIGRCCWVCPRRGCLCVCPWLPARVGVR